MMRMMPLKNWPTCSKASSAKRKRNFRFSIFDLRLEMKFNRKSQIANRKCTNVEIKKGIGVSPGVVISTTVVLDAEALIIPRRNVKPKEVAGEVERFGKAVTETVEDLKKLRDQVTAEHGKQIGAIFDFHMGLLKDPTLMKE